MFANPATKVERVKPTRVVHCIRCGAVDQRSSHGRHLPFCGSCSAERKDIAQKAHSAVAKAIRQGRLAHQSNFACVDCGVPAQQYDHRDYADPLKVDPVCISCNHQRGPALDSKCRHIPMESI